MQTNIVAPKQNIPLLVKLFRVCQECKTIFSFRMIKKGCGCISKIFTFKRNKCGYTDTWRTYSKSVVFLDDYPLIAKSVYLAIIIGCFYLLLNSNSIQEYYYWNVRMCPWCM